MVISTALAYSLAAGLGAASAMVMATDHGSTTLTIITVPPIIGTVVGAVVWVTATTLGA